MCLLSVSTVKFLLIALVALCVYELGVVLYFKFLKSDDAQISKNEARKRRERVSDSPAPVADSRKSSSKKKESKGRESTSGWEDLIDYRKSSSISSRNASSLSTDRQTPVIDAFSPEDTHADFSRMDEENRDSVEDLLCAGVSPKTAPEAPVHTREAEAASSAENICVGTEMEDSASPRQVDPEGKKESASDLNSIFSEIDYSNMLG